MTRWEVFQLLGECLRPALSSGRPRIPSTSVPWPLVVEAADSHLVAPALGWCLRDDERIPVDARMCFETLLDLNRRRNNLMLQALDGAAGALNAAGISPMVLKGAAALVEDLYPDQGMRIVGDLDLLLRDSEIERAVAALEQAGFRDFDPRESFDADPHHLPPMIHTDLRVGIELHRRPVEHALDPLLGATECFANAQPRTWRDRQILVPGPTDWLVHTIAHGQLADGHYYRGIPRLRQLLDIALLRTRHGAAIDATAANERFARAGYGRVFTDTVLLSDVLLERPERVRSVGGDARVIKRLRAAVDRPGTYRWSVYRRFLARNARRLIENPHFLVQTLRPSFWAREVKGVRRRIRTSRW